MNDIRIIHRKIPWNVKYYYAKEYYDKHGDLNVPKDYVCMDGTTWLYKWCISERVRIKKKKVTKEQLFLLNAIGINKKITTEGYLKRLNEYYNKHGNINVPRNYPIDEEGYNLGAYVSRQTFKYREGKLNDTIKNELDKLGVCWYYRKDRYLVSFPEKCILYYVSKYYPDVVGSYKELGFELDIYIPSLKLGIEYDGQNWHRNIDRDLLKNKKCETKGIKLIRLREENCPPMESSENTTVIKVGIERMENDKLNKAIRSLLCTIKESKSLDDSIDIDRDWDKINKDYVSRNEMKWEYMYQLAKEYYHANGNLLIPASFTVNGILVGSWIQNQRQNYKNHKVMSQNHIDKLNEIGMVWDVLEYQWDKGFEHFKKAVSKNDNNRVKYIYVDDDGYRTGSWVQTQVEQYQLGKLPEDRYEKLLDVNFFNIQRINLK